MSALLLLLAVCSGCDSSQEASELDRPSPSATPSEAPTQPSGSADQALAAKCQRAARVVVEALNQAWEPVGRTNPSDPTASFLASGWVLQYQQAMAALDAGGCGTPEPMIALDSAVTRMSSAVQADAPLTGVIPEVASDLRAASTALGVASGLAADCSQLVRDVDVSFQLLNEGSESGQNLYPRVSVRNQGDDAVIVQLSGQGSASSGFGSPLRMSWGGYTDSRLGVAAGASKSIVLGRDTGETLYVASGQRVLSANMTARVSSVDGAVRGCRIKVTR